MFFVGTAPTAADGHVDISPKGLMETFRILGPREVAYLDFVGSGAETIAHLRENGRIVVMLCAFQGPPRIVRLYGRGEILEPRDHEFSRLRGLFPAEPAGRAIVHISITRIADSCGYGVPLYSFRRTPLSASRLRVTERYARPSSVPARQESVQHRQPS